MDEIRLKKLKCVARAICASQGTHPDAKVAWEYGGQLVRGPKRHSAIVRPERICSAWELFVNEADEALRAMEPEYEEVLRDGLVR